jgi:hypothetical protein
VNDKTLTTQPLKLAVLKSGEPTPESEGHRQERFPKTGRSQERIYLGEVLALELRSTRGRAISASRRN